MRRLLRRCENGSIAKAFVRFTFRRDGKIKEGFTELLLVRGCAVGIGNQ